MSTLKSKTVTIISSVVILTGIAAQIFTQVKPRRPTPQEQFAQVLETNKIRIPMKVHFLNETIIAEQNSQVSEIWAEVEASKGLLGLGVRYQWDLPEGVTSDQPLSDFAPVDSDGRVLIRAQVQGFSKEQFKTLALHVSSEDGSTSASHVLVSRPEDTLEAKAVQMMESAQEFEQNQPKAE